MIHARGFVFFMVLGCFGALVVAPAAAQPRRKIPESLVTSTQNSGSSRVIVQIATPAQGGRQEAFRVPERHVEQLLGTSARGGVQGLGNNPYVVTEVTAAGLERLERDPSIFRVYPDMAMRASLAESTELLEAPPVWQSGDRGDGIGVAVIDSGIRRDHPFLKDRIIAEACFSSTSDTIKSTSLCPSGKDEEIGPGAARDCGPRDDPKGCGHGTHVAGIIAGADGRAQNTQKSFNGVAPKANIIAVKVFTRIDGPTCPGNQPFCMTAYSSDTLKGLLHVEQIADTHKIGVVNMSLGGGKFDKACDEDSPLTEVIDRMTARGIAVVIAAGNEKFVGAIAHPACISNAIAVGATTKKGEIDARYSNVSNQVRIVAPGTDIVSSMGTGYAKSSGTSMAAPHVAGLFALLKMQSRDASVATMLDALQKTGKSMNDARVNKSFSLPNAKEAVAALAPQKAGVSPQPQPRQPDSPKPAEPPRTSQPTPQPGGPDCGSVCMEVGGDRRRFIFALANNRQPIHPDVLLALKQLFGDGAKIEPLGDGKLLVDVPSGASQRDIDDARKRLGGDGVRIMPDRPLQPLEPGGRLIIR
jgi:subtilisin family serine protease